MMSDDDRYLDTESDAGKREHHNQLERKRRDHIKDSFTSLRDVLPPIKGEKARSSRAQILKRAVDFIENTKRKNDAQRADIEDLRRENVLLDDQIRILQNAIESGNRAEANPIIQAHRAANQRFCSISSESDVDVTTDSDEPTKKRRKRRRISHKSAKQA